MNPSHHGCEGDRHLLSPKFSHLGKESPAEALDSCFEYFDKAAYFHHRQHHVKHSNHVNQHNSFAG